MGCWFGHSAELISTEMLEPKYGLGFMFYKCRRCGMKRIDNIHMRGDRKGKWGDEWTDNGGVLPQIYMKDKYCPKCNRKMRKYTGEGGKYMCQPNFDELRLMRNEDYHYETIKAKTEDWLEV